MFKIQAVSRAGSPAPVSWCQALCSFYSSTLPLCFLQQSAQLRHLASNRTFLLNSTVIPGCLTAPRCHVYIFSDSFILESSQPGNKNKHVRSYTQNWNVNGHTHKSWDLILQRNSQKVPHSTGSTCPRGRLPTLL